MLKPSLLPMGMALAALAGGAAAADSDRAGPDWAKAAAWYAIGEAKSPPDFSRTPAALCVGRWRLHADAVDDGAFPPDVSEAFPYALRLPGAIQAADFFRTPSLDDSAYRTGADEAEALLRRALGGDNDAARAYFMALGECSTHPEEVREGPQSRADAPAGAGAALSAEQAAAFGSAR